MIILAYGFTGTLLYTTIFNCTDESLTFIVESRQMEDVDPYRGTSVQQAQHFDKKCHTQNVDVV